VFFGASVLYGAKQGCKARVLSKQTKQRFGVLCGFPVKKSISVKTKTSRAVAGCGQFGVRCGVRVLCASKGLVLGAVRVQDVGAKQTSKARVRVYPNKASKCLLGAVLGAKQGC
jgi:hypothetical protein